MTHNKWALMEKENVAQVTLKNGKGKGILPIKIK